MLRCYAPAWRPARLVALGGAGGFSGARFWKGEAAAGAVCIRRWPREHPTRERLRFIHAVLRHAAAQGFQQLPLPVTTTAGDTFVHEDGHFWEVTRWLPGQPDFHRDPSRVRLAAAMRAVAALHRATATFPSSSRGVSPGVEKRLESVLRLRQGRAAQLADRLARHPDEGLRIRGAELLEHFAARSPHVLAELQSGLDRVVPLQPCVRDLWHDHVLFEGDRVSGILDFGALNLETVAADLARLLGSLVGNDQEAWAFALHEYQQMRPLSPAESALVQILDAGTMLLGGIQWLEWLCLEGRPFDDPERVTERIDSFLNRLRGT